MSRWRIPALPCGSPNTIVSTGDPSPAFAKPIKTQDRPGSATAILRQQETQPIRRLGRRPAISPGRITTPFPAYPSGHAGFGGTLFEMLRNIYRTDRIAFTFVSDKFDGITRDNNGLTRPVVERSFSSLSQAEKENGQSRIYLGIHWAFDASEGIAQGNRVADYVFKHAMQPRHHRGKGR